MNKSFSLSALTLALVTAAGSVAAADLGDISVYGKINASLTHEEGDISVGSKDFDSDRWAARSNASRFGVKGSSKLDNADLQAVYQLEWGIDTVNDGKGSSNHINSRNQFVGLKDSQLGSLVIGRIDTPLKESQAKIDQFNDLFYADLAAAIVGDNRADHILTYETPKIAESMTGKLSFIPGQEWDYTGATGEINSGIADGVSASFAYETEQFYAAIAIDNKVASKIGQDAIDPIYNNSTKADAALNPTTVKPLVDTISFLADSVRLVGSVKFDALTLGALYQNSTSNSDDAGVVSKKKDIDSDAYLLSAAYAIGNTTLKAQYIDSSYDLTDSSAATSVTTTEDITGWSLGVDYKLAKKTKVYAFATQWDLEKTANIDASSTYIGFGLDHSF